MKNFKALAGVVICLLVINCILIGLLWHGYNKPGEEQHIEGPADEYLTRVLELNGQQIDRYRVMRDAHRNLTQDVGQQMRLQRDSFFNTLKSSTLDKTALAELEKHILANQQRLDSATWYHFHQLRQILDPGQQAKFDEVIDQVLHQMAGPHPPGPPNRNEPPPGNAIDNRSKNDQGPPPGPPPGNGPPNRQGPPPSVQGPPPGQ